MRRGALLRLALLALAWGSSYLWIKIALRGFDPSQIMLIRLTLGALVLLAVARVTKLRLPRGIPVWGHLCVAGLLANVVPFFLFAVGEQTVDSSLAGALNATTPLWALVVGMFAGRRRTRLTPGLVTGLFVGFAGTLLIFQPWHSGTSGNSLAGVGACLAAALSYAVGYTYIDRTLAGRGIPPVALVASQLLAATGIAVLTVPFTGLGPVDLQPAPVIAVVVLGAVGTGLAVLLNYRLIEDDGATLASTVAYLLPVVAAALGAIALDESITAPTMTGIALVLAGIAVTRRKPAPAPSAAVDNSPGAAGPEATAPEAEASGPGPATEGAGSAKALSGHKQP